MSAAIASPALAGIHPHSRPWWLRWLLALCLMLHGLGLSAPVEAANAWQQTNGPGGGQMRALVINPASPSALYAGTSTGVFKSMNGGANWAPVNIGLPYAADVRSLAIAPENPFTLYAGTEGNGVFKSSDGGANWVPTSSGLTNSYVKFLAINPVDPLTLYAGTSGSGIFKSIDGGSNWALTSSGLTVSDVWSLTPDLQRAARLRTRLAHLAGEAMLGMATLDALPTALAVVDESSRIHFLNMAGRLTLAGAGSCRTRGQHLHAVDPAAQAALIHHIAAACQRQGAYA